MTDGASEGEHRYRVRFVTSAEVVVNVTGGDEDTAYDEAVRRVEEYLTTIETPDASGVAVYVSIDGVGADEMVELSEGDER